MTTKQNTATASLNPIASLRALPENTLLDLQKAHPELWQAVYDATEKLLTMSWELEGKAWDSASSRATVVESAEMTEEKAWEILNRHPAFLQTWFWAYKQAWHSLQKAMYRGSIVSPEQRQFLSEFWDDSCYKEASGYKQEGDAKVFVVYSRQTKKQGIVLSIKDNRADYRPGSHSDYYIWNYSPDLFDAEAKWAWEFLTKSIVVNFAKKCFPEAFGGLNIRIIK